MIGPVTAAAERLNHQGPVTAKLCKMAKYGESQRHQWIARCGALGIGHAF
jgi:hypothetical protein